MRPVLVSVPHLVLLLLLPGLYLADVLYGTFSLVGFDAGPSPGTLIRGAALLACLTALLWRVSWFSVYGLLFIGLAVALSLPGIAASLLADPTTETLAYEVRAVAKTLFGPTLAVFFCVAIQRWRISPDTLLHYIEACFYLLGVALFAMQTLDVGLRTYGEYASGSKGIFGPQNDISLSLGIAMVAAVYRNLLFPSATRLLLLALGTLGFIGLGTRASLLLAVAVPILCLPLVLCSSGRYLRGRVRRNLLVTVGPALLLFFMAATFFAIQEISRYDYQVHKYASLVEGSHPRAALLAAGSEHLEHRGTAGVLLGEGADSFHSGVFQHWSGQSSTTRRMVEADWFDLYGRYGLLLTVLLHAALWLLIALALLRWVLVRHPVDAVAGTALAIYTLHSALAGHALTTPIPSSLAAACAALVIMLPRMPGAAGPQGLCRG